jgi:hypothetical protein
MPSPDPHEPWGSRAFGCGCRASKSFGMLIDKFGTSWIVNGELLPT